MSSIPGGDAAQGAITRRLDAVVLLLLETGAAPARTTTEKVRRLFELGFSVSEIAAMVGKKSNYVAALRIQGQARRRAAIGRKETE